MIQLTKELAMMADETCYIVGKPRIKAGKSVVLDNPHYYSTADQAVQGALNLTMRKMVKDCGIATLQEFVQEQERLQNELKKFTTPMNRRRSPEKPGQGLSASFRE